MILTEKGRIRIPIKVEAQHLQYRYDHNKNKQFHLSRHRLSGNHRFYTTITGVSLGQK